MDKTEQSDDPNLVSFDRWLRDNPVQPPADLLANVRERLRDSVAQIDPAIDELFRMDADLFDPAMARKVRAKLDREMRDSDPVQAWFKWLAPLAAAATFVLAVIGFQSQGPQVGQVDNPAVTLAMADPAVDLDEDMTRILALATNLDASADMSKLESIGNLSFLFE